MFFEDVIYATLRVLGVVVLIINVAFSVVFTGFVLYMSAVLIDESLGTVVLVIPVCIFTLKREVKRIRKTIDMFKEATA